MILQKYWASLIKTYSIHRHTESSLEIKTHGKVVQSVESPSKGPTWVRILAAIFKVVGNIYPSQSICEANIDTSEWNETVVIEKQFLK